MERLARRGRLLAVTGTVALLSVAGCTSDGGDGGPSSGAPVSSGAPTAPSTPGTASGTDVASSSNSPASPTATGTVTGPAAPAVPTVPAGSAGAYTLVVTGTGSVTTPVAQVSCQQDGSLTADGLQLAAGGSSLRFTDVPPVGTLDIPGSADLSAEGGTFRGATDTAAVTFTWTC